MHILKPNWPQPKNVIAFTTLKNANLNQLKLPKHIIWLQQNHGINLCNIDHSYGQLLDPIVADGSYTRTKNIACIVKTADCLPILITNLNSDFVAVMHAGWRGLAKGIIDVFFDELHKIHLNLNQLLFWLGPAIGPKDFEVGEDVIEQFKDLSYHSAFKKIKTNKYLANIYELATINLFKYNINSLQIYSQYYSTYSEFNRFYSYRASGTKERMYSFIWFT